MKRAFVYICSAYRGNTAENQRKAREYCRLAYKAGYLPIAPHLLFPQFLDDKVPEERENGLDMAKALLRRCRLIMVCGEPVTEGMMNEIMLANRLNMPVASLAETLAVRKRGKTPQDGV